jgi:beta-lactamase class C
METQLLPRLGMAHTYVRVPSSAMADYAWGERDGKAVRVGRGPFDEETYGIKTTAGDLLRFIQDNMDSSGLEPAVREAVQATHVGYFKAGDLVQGLGWEQYPWPVSRELLLGGNSAEMIEQPNAAAALATPTPTDSHLLNKTGSTGGFGAYVAFIPSLKLGVVMLANRNYPIPARVEAAYGILNKLAAGQKMVR